MDEHINENLGTYLGHIQHIPTYSNLIQYPTFSGCQHVRMSVIPLGQSLVGSPQRHGAIGSGCVEPRPRIPRLGPEVYEVYGTLGWRNVPPFRVSLLNLIRFSRIIMDNWLQDESRKAFVGSQNMWKWVCHAVGETCSIFAVSFVSFREHNPLDTALNHIFFQKWHLHVDPPKCTRNRYKTKVSEGVVRGEGVAILAYSRRISCDV